MAGIESGGIWTDPFEIQVRLDFVEVGDREIMLLMDRSDSGHIDLLLKPAEVYRLVNQFMKTVETYYGTVIDHIRIADVERSPRNDATESESGQPDG